VKPGEMIPGLSSSEQERIDALIKDSPSPSMARSHLARLLEISDPGAIRNLAHEDLLPLFRLLGGSSFLSELLIREGPSWPQFLRGRMRVAGKSVAEHLADLADLFPGDPSDEEVARGIRRHKQREILRIGLRDLSFVASPGETMREMTTLADSCLETAYRCCRGALERECGRLPIAGTERDNGFTVIGMGKLGGEELNFSSDVDLIYLYEDDQGETLGGRRGKTSPRDFFTRLAERITYLMGDVTEDGFVFRTDLRLRPLGRNGPLVQSLDATLLYYESWGQSWERAALIKARPVAGDGELGAKFLKGVEPFVYRRYLDFTTVEDLRDMKLRIEQELLEPGSKERDLKRGPGGIREVEFFTQALQLVNGGYEPRIRGHNTLKALEQLARYGFIPEQERSDLSEAYLFLRNVEHRIQMVREAHSYFIPKDEEEERALARRMNIGVGTRGQERELFWNLYHDQTAVVRRSFERLFFGARREMEPESGGLAGKLWNELDREELAIEELKNLGLKDPRGSYRSLLEIRDGTPYSPPSPRRLKVMRALGPALMAELLRFGSPDQTLFNLAEFSHRVGGRTGFLSLLVENPKTMRLLIRLFATSRFLTDLFLKRPELLDSLIRVDLTRLRKTRDEMTRGLFAVLDQAEDLEDKLNTLRRYRAEEFIRIGLHDIGGELDIEEVIAQLSDLADACLGGAVRVARGEVDKSLGPLSGGEFAVLAMGKLGGREIDYHSDLDLIFIYDFQDWSGVGGAGAGSGKVHDYFMRIGQKMITVLTAPLEEGVAYKIDMRLRPSGKSGPLVTSLDAFRAYHEKSAELWERQALIKARFAAGDEAVGRAAEEVAATTAYGKGLAPEGVKEIHHLRDRMEKELAGENDSRFNLKKGRGGMVDVEFITQMLQLSHGHRHPTMRRRATLDALRALNDLNVITDADYGVLSHGYLFLRRLDHCLRLEHDQSIEILERDSDRLERVAQSLGYKGAEGMAGTDLLKDYEQQREAIRACYDGFFGACSDEVTPV